VRRALSCGCMGGRPLFDTERTSGGTIELLYDLLDELPVSVAVHGTAAGFPLRYRNRGMRDRHRAAGPALGADALEHPALRALAERVAAAGERGHLELDLVAPDGQRLRWDWAMTPLLDDGGSVVALASVVEDLTQPVLARRRMESAVDHGLHLLLEIARLAEDRPDLEEFLAAVSARLGALVEAGSVTFGRYDRERKTLVPGRPGSGVPSLPCDPEASDLVSQVVFAGRVYRGRLDLESLELRPYAHLAHLWNATGTAVLLVPWRAGNERLGAVIAYGARDPEGFTDEDAIVLIAAGHAAGLVWQRRRAELQLAERARELESLEQAKSSFLLLASHELRTPLTLLNGYVSMLGDGSQAPERLGDILPIVQHAIGRMNALVDQLMDAARMADGQVRLRTEAIDLRASVGEAVGRVVPRWGRDDDLELRLPEAAVPVTVDVLRIETAVESLLDNAFKYSVPGDRVRCELLADARRARLVVIDQGIGMSEEETAGLFVRFGRVVNARNSHIGGPGLGLFLSREIARMHGGDITVTSVIGEGSRFELSLPLEAGEEVRS